MKRDAGHMNADLRRRVGADTTCRSTRRAFLIALGASALATPLAVIAQQQPTKIPRVGYLVFGRPAQRLHEAFRQGLRELGYVEGRNIIVEYRFAEGKVERLQELAEELVRLKVDVIVAPDPPSFHAAMKATKTIPIVMRSSFDPVASGIVASLAHPGGNVTGVFSLYSELNGKRMELLKEAVPTTSRVMVLLNSQSADAKMELGIAEGAARSLGLHLLPQEVRSAGDFENAFKAATRERANGLLVLRSPLTLANAARIASLAAKARLPAIYDDVPYMEAGGLMSYGSNLPELYRHTATYVDKILKGAKPSDLPVEQPTKLELVINLKTAKTLGIKIPNSILVRATKVIE